MRQKKALKIPSKVKIGYSTFKIQSKNSKWKEKNDAVGLCTVDKSLIEYCAEQTESELVNTILHEILHAVIYIFDIEFGSDSKEEYFVRKMTNGLHTLFVDNPELLSWLIQECKTKNGN